MNIDEFQKAMREVERHNRSMMADSLSLIQCVDDIRNGKNISDAIGELLNAFNAGNQVSGGEK